MSAEPLKTRATRLQVPKTPVYTSTCSGKSYYTSVKNHFHEMNGDIGMAGWK